MKKLFEIPESEKRRILEMHLNATKKNYLFEQAVDNGVNNKLENTPTKVADSDESFCKDYYCNVSGGVPTCSKQLDEANKIVQDHSIINGQNVTQLPIIGRALVDKSKFKKFGTEGQKGTVANEAARITSNVIVPEMETSTENWRKLDEACKGGDRAACCVIGKLSAQIKYAKNSIKPEEANAKGEKSRFAACVITSANKIQDETQGTKTDEIILSPKIPFDQIFDNNSPIIKDEMRRSLSEFLDGTIRTYGRDLTVIGIDIKTSSSRFRNTGDYETKTFKQLSEDRTNNAYDFVTEMLREKGFKFSEFTPNLDSNGSNGDGSSGPNPPDGYKYVDKGDVTMNTTPTQSRDELGAPHTNPEEYEKYKYCIITFKIKVPPRNIPGQPGKWNLEYFFYIYDINNEDTEPLMFKSKITRIIQNILN